jgi:hypothetical protein
MEYNIDIAVLKSERGGVVWAGLSSRKRKTSSTTQDNCFTALIFF